MVSVDDLYNAFANKPKDGTVSEVPDYIKNRLAPEIVVEPNTEAWDKWIEDEADVSDDTLESLRQLSGEAAIELAKPEWQLWGDVAPKLSAVLEAYHNGNHTLEEVEAMLNEQPALPQGVTDADGNILQPGFQAMPVKPGYQQLARVLALAYSQSANGKGTQRHGGDALGGYPVWDHQPIMGITRMVGPGGPAFQAIKKLQEAMGMHGRGETQAAMKEVLGTIVYAAAVYYALEEAEFHQQ